MERVDGRELWFLTGSQLLYGEETLRQVAEQSQEIVGMLNSGPEIGLTVRWMDVLTDASAIRRACLSSRLQAPRGLKAAPRYWRCAAEAARRAPARSGSRAAHPGPQAGTPGRS